MDVNLDGRTLTDEFPPDATLQQCVTKVREKHLGTRMVISIAYDGQTLLDQELGARLNQPVGGVRQIDMISAEPSELAATAFREVARQMATAGERYQALADEVSGGEAAKALLRFGEYLQDWQSCQRAILEGSRMLATDLTALECDGRTVRSHLNELADRLKELRAAFEAGDMVLLADLFRYELPKNCVIWEGVLKEMAEQIEHAPV